MIEQMESRRRKRKNVLGDKRKGKERRMKWLLYLIFGMLLAFVFYTLDIMNKIQQDIRFIKHNIEKNM